MYARVPAQDFLSLIQCAMSTQAPRRVAIKPVTDHQVAGAPKPLDIACYEPPSRPLGNRRYERWLCTGTALVSRPPAVVTEASPSGEAGRNGSGCRQIGAGRQDARAGTGTTVRAAKVRGFAG